MYLATATDGLPDNLDNSFLATMNRIVFLVSWETARCRLFGFHKADSCDSLEEKLTEHFDKFKLDKHLIQLWSHSYQ